MYQVALGKVTVTTAGTPKIIASKITNDAFPVNLLPNGKCHKIEFFPFLANTGGMYIGLSTTSMQAPAFVASTGVGVLKEIASPAANGKQDWFEACADEELNSLNPSDYLVDSAVNGESVYVVL